VTDAVWTVRAALDWTAEYLDQKGIEQPRVSAEWLLSAATGLSRVELYAYHDRPLTDDERARLRESVKLRSEGTPLQYVTGEMPFRHIVVHVEEGVFIPRPETEMLVDAVLEALRADPERDIEEGELRVIDLCVGSGCVSCALATEIPSARVWGTDLNLDAVRVAGENAARLSVDDRVTVAEGDLFEGVPGELRGMVDVVIANPPYIPSADLPDLPPEILGYEPHLALDGGPDGLAIARRIMDQARGWLAPGGVLALELDEGCVDNAHTELQAWYEHTHVEKDLAGRDRVIVGVYGRDEG
jgi:release factor glutamine methyltransferase